MFHKSPLILIFLFPISLNTVKYNFIILNQILSVSHATLHKDKQKYLETSFDTKIGGFGYELHEENHSSQLSFRRVEGVGHPYD